MPPRKLSYSQNAFYNTTGTIVYNLCIWATTMLAVRLLADYEKAGILQLAMSVTNVFAVIATYELRTFLISDVREDYRTGDYLASAVVAGMGALLLCGAYALFFGYSGETLLIILAYMLFRGVGCFGELYFGVEQRRQRMDYIGVSHVLRGVGAAGVFALVLRLRGGLLMATLAMAAVSLLVLILYDRPKAARLEDVQLTFRPERIRALLGRCLPAVLSAAAFTAIATIPRQLLNGMFDEKALGYYATVATPIVIVQVLATGLFAPGLRELAEQIDRRDEKGLAATGKRFLWILLAFTAAAYLGAWLLGEWALTLLYGESLRPYCYLMYAVLGCTVLYSACWLTRSMLVILRRMRSQLVFTLASLAAAVLTGRGLIRRFGMNGVSYAILLSYGVFLALSLGAILRTLRKQRKE